MNPGMNNILPVVESAAPGTTRSLRSLETPCLLLDEARMNRNIGRLRDRLARAGVGFSPHLKTAKSMVVAQRLITGPHGPATVSTLREAEEFAAGGFVVVRLAGVPGQPDKPSDALSFGFEVANHVFVA